MRRATNWIIAFVLVAVGATSAELGHLANATRAVGARPPLRRQLVRWRSPEVRPQAQPLRRCRRPQRSMPRPPFRGVRSMAAADNTVTAGWQVSGLPEPFRAAERAAIGTTARVVVWPGRLLLEPALATIDDELARLDQEASRFQPRLRGVPDS